MKKSVWAIAFLLLVMGIFFSVRDYKNWHHIETDRFGQGTAASEELVAAKSLSLPYSSFIGSFRIKPPLGWTVTENMTLKNMYPVPVLPQQRLTEIVRFKDPNSEAQVVITAEKTSADVVALINSQAVGITREREYITAGDTTIVVLTWDMSTQVVQKAVVYANGDFIIITASSSSISWKIWQKTFESMYGTWIRI